MEEAAVEFEKVLEADLQRLYDPIPYNRSLYYLGRCYRNSGDRSRAGEYFKRFLNRWGDGTIDPDKIAFAKKSIQS
jgi:hypothetical protein